MAPRVVLALAAASALGCGSSRGAPPDGAPPDATTQQDAGPTDAAPTWDGAVPSAMIFWSGFEGSSAPQPLDASDCYGNGCWQDMGGTDTTTGFTWPPIVADGGGQFQMLANAANPVDPNTVGQYMQNQIVLDAGRDGSAALYSEISQSGCCGTASQGGGSTQDPFQLHPASDVGELYMSYWVKLQADLADKLDAGDAWRVLFEWKTNDDDYRISVNVIAYGGVTPFWRIIGDDLAAHTEYWRIDDTQTPVPAGEWFKFEIYWHRSSGSDGRVWAAIDGHTIADHAGPNMGTTSAPINRIMTWNLYSGSTYPIWQWVDDLQIWSTFPTAAAGEPWFDPPYAPH